MWTHRTLTDVVEMRRPDGSLLCYDLYADGPEPSVATLYAHMIGGFVPAIGLRVSFLEGMVPWWDEPVVLKVVVGEREYHTGDYETALFLQDSPVDQ